MTCKNKNKLNSRSPLHISEQLNKSNSEGNFVDKNEDNTFRQYVEIMSMIMKELSLISSGVEGSELTFKHFFYY